jgi:predicted DNA repair protein MutK
LDDIASILDDVALMTKTAAVKTVGIVGDDLAVTAEQMTGFRAAREIPVVAAVAKGSMVNKLILIPAALIISSVLPWLLKPLLMVGGSWLCLEGAEKLFEKGEKLLERLRHGRRPPPPGGADSLSKDPEASSAAPPAPAAEAEAEALAFDAAKDAKGAKGPNAAPASGPPPADPAEAPSKGTGAAAYEAAVAASTVSVSEEELLQKERVKISGAVRTDFVLSAEIITIALGALPEGLSFVTKTGALIGVGIIMTLGVYGFVACIVKLDDLGFLLLRKPDRGPLRDRIGRLLVKSAPHIMRFLGIVGTVAMFLVGGGILLHNIFPHLHIEPHILLYSANIGAGLAAGFAILALLGAGGRIWGLFKGKKAA